MKFLIIPVCLLLLVSCGSVDSAKNKQVHVVKTPSQYQFATVEKGGVLSVIKLPAQLAAYQEVSIFPKVNAYVRSVSVDVGSHVKQGDVLMELEAPELIQAVAQAREKYAVAQAQFAIDKEKYNRLLEAAQTAGAISPLDLSTVRSKMQADSALGNSEKTNWQMQRTMLSYLTVTAPFPGVITDRNVHPGALVSASSKDKSMLELKQISHLRLQVDVPEAMASRLKINDTVSFYVSALQGKKLTGKIGRKSMDINTQFRSERIEIDIPNNDELLAAGMYADVTLYSKGNISALRVPRSAVITSTDRKFVLVLHDGRLLRKDVTTGNITTEKAEIYGSIAPGDTVVVNANDEIKEGLLVQH